MAATALACHPDRSGGSAVEDRVPGRHVPGVQAPLDGDWLAATLSIVAITGVWH
jgi:hypothetical protein